MLEFIFIMIARFALWGIAIAVIGFGFMGIVLLYQKVTDWFKDLKSPEDLQERGIQNSSPTRQKPHQVKKPNIPVSEVDQEFLGKILAPYGHKILIQNNSYFVVIDNEAQQFNTKEELYTFLKAKGFI